MHEYPQIDESEELYAYDLELEWQQWEEEREAREMEAQYNARLEELELDL